MDVALISPDSVKIKTKQALFVVGSFDEKAKFAPNATLLLGNTQTTTLFSENYGVVFQGPGEYETKGVKVTGFQSENQTMYTVSADGLSIFVGKISSSLLSKDTLHEHDIAILSCDEIINQSIMGFLNAHVIIFYGEKTNECIKVIGKEVGSSVGKYAVVKEKLPSETEVVMLG